MTMTYYDAASLAFGRRPFTTAEFRLRVGSERPAKLLHELKARGLAKRVARGTYCLLAPEERPDTRSSEWGAVRGLLLHAPLHMAWAGPTAVEAWTLGRYRIAASPFLREFFIAVPRGEVGKWRRYLATHGLPTHPRRRIGSRIVLEPRDTWRIAHVGGEPVVPRSEVVRLIRNAPGAYAEAEALLAA